MNLVFERATAADVEPLVSLQIAAFHSDALLYPGVEASGPPGYDSVSDTLAKIEEDECYKIVADGQIVGGFVVFVVGDGHYHLDLLFVAPAFHNLGIGTAAMQFIEHTFPATRWTLDTPQWATRNRHFYEKLGYVGQYEHTHGDTPLIAYEKRMPQRTANSPEA